MATYRAVEPELFRHPVLRRGGMVARDIYIALIVCYADDEGRFRFDPEAVLDTTFTRRDPVTLEQVQAALCFLCDEGLILLYGDSDQYGFITGWFEHQKLERRDVSSLPPPPCDVCSWGRVDEIRRDRAKNLGCDLKQVRADEALRHHAQAKLVSSTPRPRAVHEPSTEREPDLTGPNVTEGTSTPLVGVNGLADAGGTVNGADTDLHLLPLPAPLTEDGGNGKRKRQGSRTARPRYKAREPEKMDADEADADALLEAAGLAHRVDAMLQLVADTSVSGVLTQRAAIEQKLRILHTANQYGVANTNAGIEAAIRAEAGAEYVAKVAHGAYLKEVRDTDGDQYPRGDF